MSRVNILQEIFLFYSGTQYDNISQEEDSTMYYYSTFYLQQNILTCT